MIVESTAVVRAPPRPIDPVFHLHVGGPEMVVDLIAPPCCVRVKSLR